MPLPRELWDDIVPESTTVVGDIETFVAYVEYGDAWRDWCRRVQQSVQSMGEEIGIVSSDIVQHLLEHP